MKNTVTHALENANNEPTVIKISNENNEDLEVIIHSPSNKKSIHISGKNIPLGYNFDLTDIQVLAIISMLKA